MFTRSVVALAAAAALAVPQASFAWGKKGHETVGYLAGLLLAGTHAETQVKALLHSDETWATIGEWMDCAKGKTYCQKEPTQEMKDYAQKNPKHKSYHYTDVPFQLDEYDENHPGAGQDDVIHALNDAILVLQGKTPPSGRDLTKREALFILGHMTGDIHQPLHVGAAYIDDALEYIVPQDADEEKTTFTEGGNWMCHGSKGVHSFWDDTVVVSAMKTAKATTPKAFAQKLLPKAKLVATDPGKVNTWPTVWATDSLNLSMQELALLTVTEKREASSGRNPCQLTGARSNKPVWAVEFPDDYAKDGAQTAAEQITKAGARLAKTLRAIWP